MRTIYLILVMGFLFISANLAENPSAELAIVGNWQTIDDETLKPRSVVRIFRATNGKYYGRIEQILNPDPGREDPDCDNCKGKFSHYRTPDGKVVGITFLRSLEFNPRTNRWDSGTIFDPQKGREYRCEVWLEDNQLMVRGIHWTGLSRTQVWHPVED